MANKTPIRTAAETGAKQQGRPFQPGQSGNPAGRPKGARSKLGEDFLAAIQEDFAEHGRAAIERVRGERPDVYLKVVAGLMPKEMKVELPAKSYERMTDEELEAVIHEAQDCELGRIEREL